MLPVGVKPQNADAAAKPITPITTIRRRPRTSPSRPPKANSADNESRYPLITHCVPVADNDSCFWMFGIAIATIVWSMNVIATANTIAASTRFLFVVIGSAYLHSSARRRQDLSPHAWVALVRGLVSGVSA